MNEVVACPFSVGDRLEPTNVSVGLGLPVTVTAVHVGGFDWALDEPMALIPRDGSWYQTGTCYPAGFGYYRRVPMRP
jgi:hypothetical protein